MMKSINMSRQTDLSMIRTKHHMKDAGEYPRFISKPFRSPCMYSALYQFMLIKKFCETRHRRTEKIVSTQSG